MSFETGSLNVWSNTSACLNFSDAAVSAIEGERKREGGITTASETAALLPSSEHHTETSYLHENREEIGHTITDLVVNSSQHSLHSCTDSTVPQVVQPVQSTHNPSDVPFESEPEKITIAGISAGTNKSDKNLLVLPTAALQRQFSQEYPRQKILEGPCPTTPTAVTPTDQ
uniref:Uncharacterized protein n=1 Tax=Amphimedon queenslandica TaxID=400682 RepID=A0A1X7TZF4_AMPQE